MCMDFVKEMQFSVDYAYFEDICRHFNLNESMREDVYGFC
nr:MAG TPA: Nse4 C-terminal [Caudoviricetes sp.]